MDFTSGLAQLRRIADDTVEALPSVLLAVALFVVIAAVASALKRLVRRSGAARKRTRNLGIVLGRLIQGAGMAVAALVALTVVLPGFTPTRAVGALGLGGIAAGFAFKDILQNFLAGILILVTEPFRIGDQIVLDRYEGTIEEIEARATKIRTYDGRQIVIPNAELFTNPVTVNTAYPERRLEYDLGIGYGDDIGRARGWILEAIAESDGVLRDPPPDALVVGLADNAVQIRARWWIRPPRRANALDLQDRVLEAIKEKLQSNGVDLPFPTRQILFHDQTEETDGDRARQREGWPAGDGAVPRPRAANGPRANGGVAPGEVAPESPA